MQPEEIIQQKEWHQLSAEEKKILQPLAADEQEFNLLKKMLLVADEVGSEVPAIKPAVQEQLSRSVKQGNYKKSDRKIWYYAAATVVLVTISAWFYLRTRVDDRQEIVNIPPEKKTESPVVISTPLDNKIKKDSPQSIERIVLEKKAVDPGIAKQAIPKDSLNTPVIHLPDNFTNPDIAFVNTSTLIKDDTELMSLITEVY